MTQRYVNEQSAHPNRRPAQQKAFVKSTREPPRQRLTLCAPLREVLKRFDTEWEKTEEKKDEMLQMDESDVEWAEKQELLKAHKMPQMRREMNDLKKKMKMKSVSGL